MKNNFFVKGIYEEGSLQLKYSGVVKFFVSSETQSTNDLAFNYKLASFFVEEVTYEGKIYRGHDIYGITFPYEVSVKLDIQSILSYKGKQYPQKLFLRSGKYEMYPLTNSEKGKIKAMNVSFSEMEKGLGFEFELLKTLNISRLFQKDSFSNEIINRIKSTSKEKTKQESQDEYTRLLSEGNIRLSENNYEQALFSFLKAKQFALNSNFIDEKIDIVDSFLNKSKSDYRWKNRNEEKAVELDPLSNLKNELKIKGTFTNIQKEKAFYKSVDKAYNYIEKGNYKKAIKELDEAKEHTTNKQSIVDKIAVLKNEIKSGKRKKDVQLSVSEQAKRSKEKEDKAALFEDYKKYSNNKKSDKTAPTKKVNKDESYANLLKEASAYLKNKEYIKSQKAYQKARSKATDKSAIDKILVSVNKLAKNQKAIKKADTKLLASKKKLEPTVNTKDKQPSKRIIDNESGTVNTPNTIAVVDSPSKKANLPVVKEKIKKKVSKNKTNAVAKASKINTKNTTTATTTTNNNNNESVVLNTDTKTINVAKSVTPKKINNTSAKGEYISFKKGFIKYKRDQQAVVANDGETLIPFGKYKIMHYRAGFARIRIQDSIAQKTIECANRNDEYSWSARIHQNPWQETVINSDGTSVDEVLKKVEVYVVSNVSLLPFDELSNEIIKAYKDPNPYVGTKRISAHNLWNRKHADEPKVIERRAEIERFKEASKLEAYDGTNKCKEEVSAYMKEVHDYYNELGYEVILK